MTVIISAFPCLGKTTLTNQHSDRYLDMEFYESRVTKNMSESQIDQFFANCASTIQLIYDTDAYDVIFITDDDRLIAKLNDLNISIIHVLPNPFNYYHLAEYKQRVIHRSGIDWYEQVLSNDVNQLSDKIDHLRYQNATIYFVEPNKYLEHLVPELKE